MITIDGGHIGRSHSSKNATENTILFCICVLNTFYLHKRGLIINLVHFRNKKYTNYHALCQLCGNDQRLRSGFNFRLSTVWDAQSVYIRYLWNGLSLHHVIREHITNLHPTKYKSIFSKIILNFEKYQSIFMSSIVAMYTTKFLKIIKKSNSGLKNVDIYKLIYHYGKSVYSSIKTILIVPSPQMIQYYADQWSLSMFVVGGHFCKYACVSFIFIFI